MKIIKTGTITFSNAGRNVIVDGWAYSGDIDGLRLSAAMMSLWWSLRFVCCALKEGALRKRATR